MSTASCSKRILDIGLIRPGPPPSTQQIVDAWNAGSFWLEQSLTDENAALIGEIFAARCERQGNQDFTRAERVKLLDLFLSAAEE